MKSYIFTGLFVAVITAFSTFMVGIRTAEAEMHHDTMQVAFGLDLDTPALTPFTALGVRKAADEDIENKPEADNEQARMLDREQKRDTAYACGGAKKSSKKDGSDDEEEEKDEEGASLNPFTAPGADMSTACGGAKKSSKTDGSDGEEEEKDEEGASLNPFTAPGADMSTVCGGAKKSSKTDGSDGEDEEKSDTDSQES